MLPGFCGKCHSQGHNRKIANGRMMVIVMDVILKKIGDMNMKVWVSKTNAKENQDGAVLENIEGPRDVSTSKKKS